LTINHDEENDEDTVAPVSIITKLDLGKGNDFLYIRMGQLVERGKEG